MAVFEVGLPPPPPPLFLDQTEAVRTGKSIFEPVLRVLRPVFDWYPDRDKMKGQGTGTA